MKSSEMGCKTPLSRWIPKMLGQEVILIFMNCMNQETLSIILEKRDQNKKILRSKTHNNMRIKMKSSEMGCKTPLSRWIPKMLGQEVIVIFMNCMNQERLSIILEKRDHNKKILRSKTHNNMRIKMMSSEMGCKTPLSRWIPKMLGQEVIVIFMNCMNQERLSIILEKKDQNKKIL